MEVNSKLRISIALSICTGLFAIASCITPESAREEKGYSEGHQHAETETVSNPATPLDTVDTEVLLGMTKQEAEAFASEHNVLFRVVKEDGQFYAVTKDYRIGRINATIEKGIIVDYFIEGNEKSEEKDEWVGRTEAAAISYAERKKIPFRVIQRDGEYMIVTQDYVKGRVNAVVNKGIVTGYSIE